MKLLNFRFPPFVYVTLGLFVSGSLQYNVKYPTPSKDSLYLSLEGDLKASIEIVNGPKSPIVKFNAGGDGTLISTSGYAMVTKNDIVKGFKSYGTTINSWVVAKRVAMFIEKTVWKKTYDFIDNWSN